MKLSIKCVIFVTSSLPSTTIRMDSVTTESASSTAFSDVCHQLGTDPACGLTWNEAKRRLAHFGYNELNVKPAESLLSKYLEQVCAFIYIY